MQKSGYAHSINSLPDQPFEQGMIILYIGMLTTTNSKDWVYETW